MEELIGKNVDRAMQFLHQRRLSNWNADAAPFETRLHLGRFMLLASMITGRDLRVVALKGDVFPRPYRAILRKMAHPALLPDHAFAWTDGETIFLPVSIIDMPEEEEQEDLARLIVFFLAAQVRHGSLKIAASNRGLFERDNLTADIYWIIENSRLSSLLFREFPGMSRKWGSVVTRLAGRRPKTGQVNRAELKVEELLKQSLPAMPSDLPASNSPEESLLIAGKIKERWIEEGVPVKRYRGMVPFSPWGRLVAGRIKSAVVDNIPVDDMETEKSTASGKKKEEEVNNNRYMTKRENVDEENNEQGLALNIFDKMITWAAFVNAPRPFDDDPEDEIGKKADEMEELTIAQIKKSTNSFFDAELEKAESVSEDISDMEEIDEKIFLYPEWDYRTKAYREDFSRLLETVADEENGNFVDTVLSEKRGVIKEVKRKFERLTPSVRRVNRQPDGDCIDIEAAVEAMVDLESGRQPDDRLFTTHKRMERDISSLFLVDLSMSTETWVKDRRIIDHEKEALIVLCEAMQSLRERHSIYGFSGKTRKEVRYFGIKGFDEAYNEKVKRRIGGLIPYHYTRMGPAIRHASSILEKETSAIRLLFLLSDGKPNDLDQYEGRYGIEDTRMAIREAERKGIVPFCLTVDSKAGDYLPGLFGRGNYAVVSGIDGLAKGLPDLYAKIIRQL